MPGSILWVVAYHGARHAQEAGYAVLPHGGEDLLGFRSAKRKVGRGSRSEDYQHGICALNPGSSIACRPFDARFRIAH
jgi:hypothetical protein